MIQDDNKLKGFYDDDWWLDYLENEVDISMKNQMAKSLTSSLSDRRSFKSLEKLRRAIKSSDDVALPEDLNFYVNMNQKIMAAVEELDQPLKETKGLLFTKSWQRERLRGES